jgi:hypothetical protein
MGRLVEVIKVLAEDDCEGGKAFDEQPETLVVTNAIAMNPMWHDSNFGNVYRVLSGPRAGTLFHSARIDRYRVRKPRALRDLIQMVETLPQEEDA